MRKHLKKYFIPHDGNNHKPHILRETAVTVFAVLVLSAFVFSAIHTALLISNSEFLAAVLPRVLVDLTNDNREDNELSQLTLSTVLEEAAQLKANDMAENSYFAHVSPSGVTPWSWFVEAGYQFVSAGENLAVNFSDSEDVEEAWMDSEGHRANILNGDFTEIGIATSRGEYKGKETVFVVQFFGRPAATQIAQIPESIVQGAVVSVEEPILATEAKDAPAPKRTVEIVEVSEPVDDSGIAEVAEVPDTLEVIREDNLFIAVRDTSIIEEFSNEELAGVEAVGLLAPEQTNFVERLFAQPRNLLDIIYIILGAIVLLSLILNIGIEVKHQHPLHIAYGVLLLVLIVSLTYIYRTYIFADLLII